MFFADNAALTAHTEETRQHLITSFADACSEFNLIISLKKSNIMGQNASCTPYISISNNILEVVDNFIYLGSTISSNLSLDAELNMRIGKEATTLVHCAKRAYEKLAQTRHLLHSTHFLSLNTGNTFCDTSLH